MVKDDRNKSVMSSQGVYVGTVNQYVTNTDTSWWVVLNSVLQNHWVLKPRSLSNLLPQCTWLNTALRFQ